MRRFIFISILIVLVFSTVSWAQTPIRLWFAGTPQVLMDAMYDQMIPEFHRQNSDIRLEVEFIPWGELSTKLATSFAGGVAPDIFMHGQAAIAEFVESGQLLALDQFIENWGGAADFGETLQAGVYKGNYYQIPVFGAGRLLMYRADQFVEVGLNPDNPPATWEELLEAAQLLTISRGNRLVREGLDIPIEAINAQQVWAGFLWQNGGAFLNDDMTAAVFNSPEGVESLQFLVDLIHKYQTSDTREAQPLGNAPAIATGHVAMVYEVPGVLKDIQQYAPDVYQHIRIAMPTMRQTQDTLYSFSGFMMSKGVRNPEAAWRVMEYFTSYDALEQINKFMATLPPRQSLAEAEFIAQDPNLQAYVTAMQYGRGNPNHPRWVQIRDIVSRYVERALRGVMSAQDALDEAAREVNRILAQQ